MKPMRFQAEINISATIVMSFFVKDLYWKVIEEYTRIFFEICVNKYALKDNPRVHTKQKHDL